MTPFARKAARAARTRLTLHTRNVLAVYYAADLLELQAGAAWYDQANALANTLASLYQISPLVAAGVLAAVSPIKSWKSNVALAERLLAVRAATGATALAQGGYLPLGLGKVDALLALAEPTADAVASILGGNKITAFFQCIAGDGNGVCVDGHAQNIALHGRVRKPITDAGKITDAQYLAFANAYRAAAKAAGTTAAVMQAVTWVAYRNQPVN